MRKYQKLLLAFMLVFVITQTIDAAPRNRRRARRAAQRYTKTSNNSTRNYRTSNYQSPPNQTDFTIPPPAKPLQSSAQPYREDSILSGDTEVASQPAISSSVTTPQSTTPLDGTAEPRTLSVGDALPIVPPTDSSPAVVTASYQTTVGTTSNEAAASDRPVVLASYDQAPIQTQSSSQAAVVYTSSPASSSGAIAEVNAIRARCGLRPFIEDHSLSIVAHRKARIQANRRAMGHPGGSMGGARYEGVGMGHAFTSCYLYSTGGQYAGAASVRGANGQRYHCLLVR